MTTQDIKDRENQLHDIVHRNISTLTLLYPTTEEFRDKFKPGMFRKNNQQGAQQVIYYLLSVIDPEKIKERITSWPLGGIRLESKFRVEVMRFYNQLHEKYAEFGLQTLLSSHLITPGGYKFTRFIWKLSDLALFVHLSSDEISLRIKISRDTFMTEDKLLHYRNVSKRLNTEVSNLIDKHEQVRASYDSELISISDNLRDVKTKIYDLTKIGVPQDASSSMNCSIEKESEELLKKTEIKDAVSKLRIVAKYYEECTELCNYILSNDNVLLYDKSNLVIKDLCHTVTSENNLDLIKFFEAFLSYLQKNITRTAYLPLTFILSETDKLQKIIIEQEQVCNKTKLVLNKFIKAVNEINNYKLNRVNCTTLVNI